MLLGRKEKYARLVTGRNRPFVGAFTLAENVTRKTKESANTLFELERGTRSSFVTFMVVIFFRIGEKKKRKKKKRKEK